MNFCPGTEDALLQKRQDLILYRQLSGNAAMFVTAWFGMVDINTGKVMCGSAGHNPPALINDETGEVKYLDYKPQLVLGAMQNIAYKNYIFQMKENEKLMLYTDGIVEAHDVNNKLYGEERFLKSMETHKDLNIRDLCENLAFEVDEYSKGQEQFDDYSLLCFTYKGAQENKNLSKDF